MVATPELFVCLETAVADICLDDEAEEALLAWCSAMALVVEELSSPMTIEEWTSLLVPEDLAL